ncbi:MAG: ATP-binding cassette domain-containing protein [Rhabdochlamydiaceae bacterium]|jgi:ABC-2 type transport system ATP-binding protein
MSIFSVRDLSKSFRIPRRQKGFWRQIAALVSPTYDTKVALDQISFDIREGELVGYIGPNGAGKSTTVKILSGILVPGSGEVKVFGKIPHLHRIEIVRQIGVVFGQRTQLWWDLQVMESFELLKAIYEIPEEEYKATVADLIEHLDLSKLLHVPVRMLSLGQRMRCDLAASLLHSPKILFLDEPTIGLDAVSKLAVRAFIYRLNKEKKVTILLTTHDMDDIEALCQRVIVLNDGKIFFDGALNRLRKQISPERYLVIDFLKEDEILEEKDVEIMRREGSRVWLKFDPLVVAASELIARIASKHAVSDLFVENPPIEETIAKLYR